MSEFHSTVHPAIKRLFSPVVHKNLGKFKPLVRCSNNKCMFLRALSRKDVYKLIDTLSGRRASLNISCPYCQSKTLYVEKMPEKNCLDCKEPIDLARRVFSPDRPLCKACQIGYESAYKSLFPGDRPPLLH